MFLPPRFYATVGRASRRIFAATTRRHNGHRCYSSTTWRAHTRRSQVAYGATVLLLSSVLLQSVEFGPEDDRAWVNAGRRSMNKVCDAISPTDAANGHERSHTCGYSWHEQTRSVMNKVQEEDSCPIEDKQDGATAEPKDLLTKGDPICFVIGTGIDASHSEFEKGQILELSNPSDDSAPTLQPSSFRIPQDDLTDEIQRCWVHETKVASVIAGKHCGVAPGTRLVDVKVAYYDESSGQCTYNDDELERRFDQIKAFLEANPSTSAIVNMSMGSSYQHNVGTKTGCVCRGEWSYPTTITRNPKVDRIIRTIYRMGTLVIASAGNDCSPAFTTWPSSNPYVLTVGSLDRNGVEDEISNFGAAVSLLARGVDVRVAYRPPNEYATVSGTSYAAPYVAGMALLILAKADTMPGLHTVELRPGALKSLLYTRMMVKQYGRNQPESMRRRSDGAEVDEISEDGAEDSSQEAKKENSGDYEKSTGSGEDTGAPQKAGSDENDQLDPKEGREKVNKERTGDGKA